MSSQNDLKRRLQALLKRPENMCCCDCPERQPRWASLIVPPPGSPPGSLPMGAFMCLECSGSHRRLGVHIAFVRSVNLDQWKEKEVIAMENGGNEKVNAIYEARIDGVEKPTVTANGTARERFIRDKYERRQFFDAEVLRQYESGEISSSSPVIVSEENESKPKISPNYFKIRTPSDAAKMRVESKTKKSHSPKKEVRQNGVTPAPTYNVVADLLDFGSMTESPVPQFDVFAAMKQHQEENNFANFSGPFDIETSNTGNYVEVTVKNESRVNLSSPALNAASATMSQPKAKPALSSDDIMKLFNQPPTQPQNTMLSGIPPANASPFMTQHLPVMGMMAPSAINNNMNSPMLLQQQGSSSIVAMNGGGAMTMQHQQHLMMQQQIFMMQQQSMNMMMKQMNANSTIPVAKSDVEFGVPVLSETILHNNMNHQQIPTLDNRTGMDNNVMANMAPMGGTTNYSGGLSISQLNIMNRLQMGNMSVGSMVSDQDQKELQQKQSLNQFGSLNMFNL